MPTKYFTLSAVCMLVFCMLLALSGTTDFPGGHPGIVPPSALVSPAPGLDRPGTGEAVASFLPVAGAQQATVQGSAPAAEGKGQNRPLFLFGVVFLLGWVLLSFRLFSKSGS